MAVCRAMDQRRWQVARLAALGVSIAVIAQRMDVSRATVKRDLYIVRTALRTFRHRKRTAN